MSIVYDAGALIAADRGDRALWADHRVRLELGRIPVTTAPVIAQVSRSPRQANLRRFLRGCETVPFDADSGHDVGRLLAVNRSADVVDAHVASVASKRSLGVLTSDEDDLRSLASHLRPRPAIVVVS